MFDVVVIKWLIITVLTSYPIDQTMCDSFYVNQGAEFCLQLIGVLFLHFWA